MKDYIQYLSFEGSGSETIIYVGVIKFLLKYNMLDNLKGIIGSGFGAIIALMIVLKLTYNEIEEIMLNTNMTNIINVKFKDIFTLPSNIMIDYGVMPNNNIKKVIEKILYDTIGDSNITLSQLFDLTNIHFAIVWTNVTKMTTVYVSHITYPKFKVADAIAIGCSIPFLFQPTLFNDEYFCDGRLFYNQPLFYFDHILNTKVKSIGFTIYPQYNKNNDAVINEFTDYTNNIFRGIFTHTSNKYFKNNKLDKRLIRILYDTNSINLDTNTGIDKKKHMIITGYNKLAKHYNKDIDGNFVLVKKSSLEQLSSCCIL